MFFYKIIHSRDAFPSYLFMKTVQCTSTSSEFSKERYDDLELLSLAPFFTIFKLRNNYYNWKETTFSEHPSRIKDSELEN